MFGEINIDTKRAINSLDDWRGEVKLALQAVYPKVGREVIRRARPRTPVLSGKLQAGLKQTAAKSAATIKVGGTKALPYAGPAHWGWDGATGPWFIYKVGYPQATKKKRGPVADWIYDWITSEVNKTIKRLNKHLSTHSGIGLAGPAAFTGG